MIFKDIEVGTIFDTCGEICIKIRNIEEYGNLKLTTWNAVCIYGKPGKLYSFIDELEVNTQVTIKPNIIFSIEKDNS